MGEGCHQHGHVPEVPQPCDATPWNAAMALLLLPLPRPRARLVLLCLLHDGGGLVRMGSEARVAQAPPLCRIKMLFCNRRSPKSGAD